jgi:hypothetical protein
VYLSQYNVEWIQMTAAQFAEQVLTQLESTTEKGISTLSKRSALGASDRGPELVAHLASKPPIKTDFLLGSEPVWVDIQSGRAILRENDEHLWITVTDLTARKGTRGIVVIGGTAGSGKSTALMRVCLKLSAAGTGVAWVDRESDISLRGIRSAMKRHDAPPVLAIDDADAYGADLASVLRDVCMADPFPLVLLGIRSGRIDQTLNRALLGKTPHQEFVMQLLTDADINGLLDALTADNKLGALRGRGRPEQIATFREKCGRELLVAMIEATSGDKFEVKASSEYEGLDPEKRMVYGIISVASSQRFSLSKKDVLVAAGVQSNAVLNALDLLARRNIIVAVGETNPTFRARHRVLADIVTRHLHDSGILYDIVRGLLLVAASQFNPDLPRSSKPYRFLVRLLNHELLNRLLGPDGTRNLYAEMENHLKDQSHFWLQRGVFEVERNNLRLAKNYLDQARGMDPDDGYIDTEYALLQFRMALENPSDPNSPLECLGFRPRASTRSNPSRAIAASGKTWATATSPENQKRRPRPFRLSPNPTLMMRAKSGCVSTPRTLARHRASITPRTGPLERKARSSRTNF